VHAGQAISLLAGAEGKGEGLKLSAAAGDIDLQAQNGPMDVQSKGHLTATSAATIDFAAKEKIHIANHHGAYITLEKNHLTFGCPGTLAIHAGQTRYTGGAKVPVDLPGMPPFEPVPPKEWEERFVLRDEATQEALPGRPYRVVDSNGKTLARGRTDHEGRTARLRTHDPKAVRVLHDGDKQGEQDKSE
jgi:uncharacterized protein (DUF2345 family)